MSDRKRKSASSADILGPLLFIAGVVPALLVVMAIFRGTPGEHATGTGALARGVILAMGHAPVLLLGAGAAGLGVRLFLGGYFESLLRHLSGLAGTAVGLAVLLGCFSMTAGGAIGASTGGFLASMITVIPATIVGLAALAAPIWFTWVRGSEFLPKKISGFDSLSAALGHGEEVAHSEEAGVSAAEADALLPDPVITREQRAISEALEQETAPAWASNDESTQPYPEDPRLKGQVPEGATPLTDPDATEERTTEAAGESAAASSSRWTPRGDTEPEVALVDDLVVSDEAASGTVEPAVAAPQAEASAELTEAPEEEVSAEAQVKVLPDTTTIAYEDNAPRPLWETSLAAVEEEASDAGTQAEAEEEDLLESTSSTLWRPAAGAEAAEETTAEADATKDDDGEWEYVEVAGSDTDWNAQEATTPAATAPELTAELGDEDDDTDDQIPEEQEDMLAVEEVDEPLSAEETETEVEEVAEVEEEDVEEDEEDEADVVLIPTAAGAQVVAEEPLATEEDVETEAEAEEEDDEEWEYVEVAEDEETPVASAETEDDDEEELEDDEEWEYVEVAEGEEGWEEAEEEEEEEEKDVVAEAEQSPVASEATEEDDEEELEDDEEWEYVEVAEGEEGWEDAEEAPELEEKEAVAEAQPLAAELEQDADTEEPAENAYEKEFAELLAAEQPEPVVEAAIETAAVLEPEVATAVAEQDVAEAEELVVEAPAEPVAEVEPEVEAAPEVEEEVAEQAEPEPVAEVQETVEVEVEAAEPEPEVVAEVQVEAMEETPAQASPSEEDAPVEAAAASESKDEVQMDLFAEPQAEAEPVAQTDGPAADEAPEPAAATAKGDSDVETTDAESAEPVVTLTPQAAGASENAMRAAEVILEAERVAVSMLQRSIGLNFKESCVVLDELQELGFIGPYIDGNRRDILMGREEWLSTVGVE